ncbi:MAG: CARDB domain-containing protein [Pyrinomonadaceae bacterium]
MRTLVCGMLIAICAWPAASANFLVNNPGELNAPASAPSPKAPKPDLIVRGNEFEFDGNKIVNVYVSNNGDAPSGSCRLELTVRKIGTAAVGRKKVATIPAIQPGQYVKIPVDASGILPANVNLKDTTFKVIADSTHIVSESNETNNEKWHNLP